MLLIPAIDLKDGKCVRLRQGRMDDDTVFSDQPIDMAKRWVDEGGRRLHLVDLNGALGVGFRFAGFGLRVSVLDFEFWVLDFGFRVLDFEFWI